MISRIKGFIREFGESQLLIDVQGFSYEVLVPSSILKDIRERTNSTGECELVTYHYHQIDMNRGTPMLIGFINEVEREFFIRFITVAGMGPKAAIKALAQPIPVIAQGIDDGNLELLRSLPGIGAQRAKEIVAKLQGKVGKFALIQTGGGVSQTARNRSSVIEEEAIAVLIQLEYKKPEAKQMVQAALQRSPKVKTAEELLNEVYRQQKMVMEPA